MYLNCPKLVRRILELGTWIRGGRELELKANSLKYGAARLLGVYPTISINI